MQSVTYGEIEEVYNALKGSRFAKISVDALTDGVLCSLEISDKNRILVKNGVKKFFRIWDKMRLNRSVPPDEVKLEVCLTVSDESDVRLPDESVVRLRLSDKTLIFQKMKK